MLSDQIGEKIGKIPFMFQYFLLMHFTHFQVFFYVKMFITVCIEQKAQQKQVNKHTYPSYISCIFKYKYFVTNMANHRKPDKPTD